MATESALNQQASYPCPSCKAPLQWSTDNPHRPFCSESCRNRDLVDWANGQRVIPGSPVYDEVLSGDLEF